ncbi:MAG: hypothetical protein LM522_06745 [Candidatus Contendobacter sp.]|nr:hypothetical protein [Candidatus Contendobacter sp.]
MERLITLEEENREEIAALSGDMVIASGDLIAKLQKHHLLIGGLSQGVGKPAVSPYR